MAHVAIPSLISSVLWLWLVVVCCRLAVSLAVRFGYDPTPYPLMPWFMASATMRGAMCPYRSTVTAIDE